MLKRALAAVLASGVLLALSPQAAAAQATARLPYVIDPNSTRQTTATPVSCLNPTTGAPESCSGVGSGSGGTSGGTATAAAPTYTEGSTAQPFSMDLNGYQRVRSKQDGTWSVGLTGGSIANTFFGARLQDGSGTAFGTTGNPVFVTGPLTSAQLASSGLATSAKQDTNTATLGSPFQAGGSIANTFFGARLQDNTGTAYGTTGNPVNVAPLGSAGSTYQQGNSGAAGASAQMVWVGGRYGAADGAAPVVPADPVAGLDGGGLKRTLAVSTGGALDVLRTGTANHVVTKTSVTANTSTTVCPATTGVIAQQLQVQTGGGIGTSGQTLTSGTYGTTTAAPDVVLSAANAQYVWLVPPTNAVTFYGAAQITVCIQDTKP